MDTAAMFDEIFSGDPVTSDALFRTLLNVEGVTENGDLKVRIAASADDESTTLIPSDVLPNGLADEIARRAPSVDECMVYLYARVNIIDAPENGYVFEGPWELDKVHMIPDSEEDAAKPEFRFSLGYRVLRVYSLTWD
jgi:hypothetical protein